AMHLGVGISLEVGFFSYVALAGLSLFLPAEFWNTRMLSRWTQVSAPDRQGTTVAQVFPRQPLPRWLHYAPQAFCAGVLLYVLALNVNSLPNPPLAEVAPETWRPLARGLGLSQMWGMFGAAPSKDGWCIAKAQL